MDRTTKQGRETMKRIPKRTWNAMYQAYTRQGRKQGDVELVARGMLAYHMQEGDSVEEAKRQYKGFLRGKGLVGEITDERADKAFQALVDHYEQVTSK
jgi:hypothetical protein